MDEKHLFYGSAASMAVMICAFIISCVVEWVVARRFSAGYLNIGRAQWAKAVSISIALSIFLTPLFIYFMGQLIWLILPKATIHFLGLFLIPWGILHLLLPGFIRLRSYQLASPKWAVLPLKKKVVFCVVCSPLVNIGAVLAAYGLLLAIN